MIRQLTVQELHERLAGDGPKPIIIDVREDWELAKCALGPAVHIPMAQIPGRLSELCKESEIVVMCHHGIRSQHVARFLEQQGFTQIFNLRGGIDAWAKQVDPDMPQY